jgi:hypothetical protein
VILSISTVVPFSTLLFNICLVQYLENPCNA